MDRHFRGTPRPEEEVIAMLERALRAAKSGRVRSAAFVLVTHQQTETACAGEMRSCRIDALLAGLTRAAHQLLNQPAAPTPEDRQDPPL